MIPVTIRPATPADAAFIAQGVLTAIGWDMFNPATAALHRQSLLELIPICQRIDTLYSYRNTLIAEAASVASLNTIQPLSPNFYAADATTSSCSPISDAQQTLISYPAPTSPTPCTLTANSLHLHSADPAPTFETSCSTSSDTYQSNSADVSLTSEASCSTSSDTHQSNSADPEPTSETSCSTSVLTQHHSDNIPADTRVGILVSYDGAHYHAMRAHTFSLLPSFRGVSLEEMADETQAGEYYMDSLCVWPHARGHHLGRHLLQAGIYRAHSLRLTPALLVDPDNPPAKRLYASLGFQPAGTVLAFDHLYERMLLQA